MKTVLDQTTEIYKLLNIATVKAAINGGIYSTLRPSDSILEDIVVNSVTTGDGSIQYGISNVNIYVPDIIEPVGGKQRYTPNTSKLRTIVNIVKPILEESYGADFSLWIDTTGIFREEAINQHYFNFRIEVRFSNY